MNCLQNIPRSSAPPVQIFKGHETMPSRFHHRPAIMNRNGPDFSHGFVMRAVSGSKSSGEMNGTKVKEEKSDIYGTNMTEAMGAVLTYRHELGINCNFIQPDLIVGSCLQSPEDVGKLRSVGVKTIFCLQQDPDLEYFGVDINAIRQYAQSFSDIEHIRVEIRDFDGFNLRMRLPAVVSKLCKAINQNGGVTYIHCTAGLGRAPSVALAYMFWVQGYKLSEAHRLLLSKRSCFPNLDAIRSATADILTGLKKKFVTLKWASDCCSTVEVSGLDIGWGQRMPLKFEKDKGSWILEKELPEGCYEYKYMLLTPRNKDGRVNNYVQVFADDPDSDSAKLHNRLTGEDPVLTMDEQLRLRQFLEEPSSD